MKSFSRGILALIIVSAILLFSDLENRNKVKKSGLTGQKGYLKSAGATLGLSKKRIALVQYIDSHNSEDCERGIRKAFEENNFREGSDFTLKVYNAQGDISTLNSIVGTVGNDTWDLVMAVSTPPAQLMAKKLVDARIVFTNVGDPVAAGLGKSFEDHLPNICGISTMSDFDGLLKLVTALHPRAKRIGTVFTPAEINSVAYKERLNASAKKFGIKLIAVPANSATEVLDAANSLVAQQIDVFCQISDNLTGSCSSAILKVSHDSKVPYYGFVSQQLKQGGVAVCARDYFQAGYDAGMMGLDVLAGKNTADIPNRFVEKTEYLLNPEAAAFFKIEVSDQLFKEFPTLKKIQ